MGNLKCGEKKTGQDVFICPKESLQQAKMVLKRNSIALQLRSGGLMQSKPKPGAALSLTRSDI